MSKLTCKRSKKPKTYKHLKRSIQHGIPKAHWGHIDNSLTEAPENKDSKLFWRFLKAQRQEHVSAVFLHLNKEVN